MSDANEHPSALTIKELLLRLDAKLDTYIAAHENRHAAELMADFQARSDPSQSPAGRAIMQRVGDVENDVAGLGGRLNMQERAVERFRGALALVSIIGFGTIFLVVLRIAGLVP